jgi:hypothetical protein
MKFCKDSYFQLNFYKWARQNAQLELEQDFYRLESIRGFTAMNALAYIKSLEENDILKLIDSLVKGSFNSEFLASIGSSLTDEDLVWRTNFTNNVIIHPIAYDAQEKIIFKMISEKQFNKNLIKKSIKKALKEALKEFFEKPEFSQGDTWGYNTQFGNWIVKTHFDVGGRSQLRYGHTIYCPIRNCTLYPSNISFLKWLGMGGETEWNLLSDVVE